MSFLTQPGQTFWPQKGILFKKIMELWNYGILFKKSEISMNEEDKNYIITNYVSLKLTN